MPDITQQEWLAYKLESYVSADLVGISWEHVARLVVQWWPSSPQGLAVEQLVELLEDARTVIHNLHCVRDKLKELHYPLCHRLSAALEAAEGK